jgi:hypothetical protein
MRPDVHCERQYGEPSIEEGLMSSLSYRSSRPDGWVQPRAHRDPSIRYMTHGPVLPMEEPSFFQRLFGRR